MVFEGFSKEYDKNLKYNSKLNHTETFNNLTMHNNYKPNLKQL